MVLLIDNYDSFTYNLVHYLRLQELEVQVVRNDEIPLLKIKEGIYEGIVISPGPGRPEQSGELMKIWQLIPANMPVLSICLGMQAMGVNAGMPLIHAPVPVHGKTVLVHHDEMGLFRGIPTPTVVMRYHSLILKEPLPPDWLATAHTTEDGLLMGMRHRFLPIEGVQFHPESIGTEFGLKMISNWATLIR